MGEGEVHLLNSHFIFIRNYLKTVILNFIYKNTDFIEEDDFLTFKTQIKKDDGSVERKYKIDFKVDNSKRKFLNEIK